MSIINRINSHVHSDFDLYKLPTSAKIELVNFCSHKCPYCMVPFVKDNKRIMSFNTFKKIVEKIPNVKEIGLFFMGESTLHPDIDKFNSYCKSKNKFTFLTTNGILLEPLLHLVDTNIDSIKISLNGYNRKTWIENTGVDSFDTVVRNVHYLHGYIKNTKSKTELSISSIFYNNDEQRQFIKSLPPVTHYYLPLYSQAGDNGYNYNKGNIGIIGSESKSIPCWALFTQAHIKVNGDLCACCFGCNKKFIMGNILDTNFEQCWNSDKFISIRQSHLLGKIPEVCMECLK